VSTPLYRFTEHTAAVKALAWSPHAHGLLASGGGQRRSGRGDDAAVGACEVATPLKRRMNCFVFLCIVLFSCSSSSGLLC
jgi:hypothetical protein